MANKSLYVGNLSYSTTEATLRQVFAEFEPAEIRLIADKGFGFVEVPEARAAEAIAALNGRDVDGRAIIVNEARPRGERPGGGGGGPRRGGGGGFGGGGGRGGAGGGGGGGGGRRRW
jgi:RNA recognition motif-containing protein